jgi:hypothetical protein
MRDTSRKVQFWYVKTHEDKLELPENEHRYMSESNMGRGGEYWQHRFM